MHLIVRNSVAALLLTTLSAAAQDRPFHFTPPDDKVLAESNEIDAQFEKKGLVLHNPKAEAYLNSVGTRLLGASPTPERVQYRFRILRDPMINAFALPNGSVYVNSGLVSTMENETELAVVMAHEVTHVVNRHTYLQNRSMRKKAVAMDILAIAAGGAGYLPIGAAFGYTLSLASQFSQIIIVATIYGYSRELETDADTTGYGRLIHAGYDGAAMARALKLLDERLEFEPTEPFWRTHPKLQERIAAAQKLARNENAADPRVTAESEYLENLAEVVRSNIVLDLDSRRARTAVARAQRLVNWKPDAAHFTVLADAYRSLGAKTSKPAGETASQQSRQIERKQMLKLTAEEEQQALLAGPAGKDVQLSNQVQAEKLYQDAMAATPSMPAPHRGLGMLYQAQGKYSEAVQEYRAYLDLSPPETIDRLRIERRVETCMSAARNATEKK